MRLPGLPCLSQSSLPSRDLLSHPAASIHQPAPEANPLQQTTLWLCSAPSSYSQFQTSVFTPRPITELFSLEELHHCLSPAAYHVSIYIYIFFFSSEGLDAAIFSTLPMCWRQFMLRDTWQRLQKYFLLVLGEASLAKEHYSASKTPFPVHSPAHEADAVLKVCFSHYTIQKPYGDPESRTRSSYPLQYDF